MKWSVLICTRNRSGDLRETLQDVERLDFPRQDFEVIVVDNASEDDTRNTVEAGAARLANLRYLREERVGLSHARNTGIDHASGEFVAFLDDDARPEPDWLVNLGKCFRDPRIACVGGKVKPVFDRETGWPDWLSRRLFGYFTVFDLPDFRYLRYPVCPVGTNLAFRRSVFTEVGVFDPRLGRIGTSLLSGEEADLCLAIDRAGLLVAYTPDAVVHHKVGAGRLTPEWVRARARWSGVSSALIERKWFSPPARLARTLKFDLILLAALVLKPMAGFFRSRRWALYCECQELFSRGFLETIRGAGKDPTEPAVL